MRIFLSVGTHPQPVDRLLREMDKVAGKERQLKIFAQSGNRAYRPRNFPSKSFLNNERFQGKIKWADVVVSHGGAGTLINALRLGKKLVVAPRLEKFGEHTNDHQLDLARAFEKEGKAIAVEKISDLEKAIKRAEKFRPKTGSNREGLVKKIQAFIEAN